MMKNKRPKSIIWFEWLFWASVFVGLVSSRIFEEREFQLLLAELFAVGLMLLFWFFIARRANNIFKWIYTFVAFFGLGLYGLVVITTVFEISLPGYQLPTMTAAEFAFGGVANGLSAIAAICLFLKPSRDWFDSKGLVVQQDDQLSEVFE